MKMGSPGNPLASLLGQYDSDNDSDEEAPVVSRVNHFLGNVRKINQEPLPPATETPVLSDSNTVLQCAWSACYDESSGYTYYWNQYTNQVTWEPPADYLQAIKMASLQATKAHSEVSSEEWQMYQQVLAEQKATTKSKPVAPVLNHKVTESTFDKRKKRRPSSDTEDEKIELITSYYNSDSESNDESDKVILPAKIESRKSDSKHVSKKLKKKHEVPVGPVMEYGPSLPPTQQDTTQIEEQFILEQIVDTKPDEISAKSQEVIDVSVEKMVDSPQDVVLATNGVVLSNGKEDTEEEKSVSSPGMVVEDNPESEHSQDESVLMRKLAEKTEILKKMGGEVPTGIDDLLKCQTESTIETHSVSTQSSPKAEDFVDDKVDESVIHNDLHKEDELFEKSVDEMLAEIESKEMKKKQTSIESDSEIEKSVLSPSQIVGDPESAVVIMGTDNVIPSSVAVATPLFPSASTTVLFPSAQNISRSPESTKEKNINEPSKFPTEPGTEVANVICLKKGANLYMRSPSEEVEMITTKRKKRIATDVLPEVRKEKKIEKTAAPSYTTKYSQYIEGFSSERTGLGFSTIADRDETLESDKKKAFVYGKYSKPVVMFTKGEVLNEEKKDSVLEVTKADTNYAEERQETSESLADTLQAKLNFLNQNAVDLPPVQEMIIQFECLRAAWLGGALQGDYWRGRLGTWARALQDLEARAAPPGWLCGFQREEGRYQYQRVSDGFVQWDYPQHLVTKEDSNDDDMDICTTPPPCDVMPDTTTPIAMHSRIPAVKAITQTIVAPIPIVSSGKLKKTSFPREVENPPLPSSIQQSAAPPPPPSWEPPPPPPPPLSLTPPPPPPSVRLPSLKTKRHASPPPPPPGTDEEEHAMYNLPAENERVESPPPPPPPPPIISQDQSLGDELMSFYSDLAELEKQPEPAPPESPYHPPEPSRQKQIQQTEEDKILNSLWSTVKKVEPAKKSAMEPVDSPRLKDSVDGTKMKKKTKVKLSSSVGLKNKNVSSMVAKWQQVKEANKDDDD